MDVSGPKLTVEGKQHGKYPELAPKPKVARNALGKLVKVEDGDAIVSGAQSSTDPKEGQDPLPPPLPPKPVASYKTNKPMAPLPESVDDKPDGESHNEGESDVYFGRMRVLSLSVPVAGNTSFSESEGDPEPSEQEATATFATDEVTPLEVQEEGTKKLVRGKTIKGLLNLKKKLSRRVSGHEPKGSSEQSKDRHKKLQRTTSSQPALPKRERHISESSRSLFYDILDFENTYSPICLAIKNVWGLEPCEIPSFEVNNIKNHCLRFLSGLPDIQDDTTIGDSLDVCLKVYVTTFKKMFPRTCATSRLEDPVWSEKFIDEVSKNNHLADHINIAGTSISKLFFINLINEVSKIIFEGVLNDDDFVNMDYDKKKLEINSFKNAIVKLNKNSSTGAEDDELDQMAAMRDDLSSIGRRLGDAVKAISVVKENDFRNQDNWKECLGLMVKSVRRAVFDNIPLVEQVQSWEKAQTFYADQVPYITKDLKERKNALYQLAGVNKDAVKHVRLDVIRQSGPTIYKKNVMYLHDGEYYSVEITHTPPACLRIGKDCAGERDPFGLDGHIVPSCQRDAEHAVNPYITRAICAGEPVVKEVRIGSPYAFAISDLKERTSITTDRLNEMLLLCGLAFREEEMEAALDNLEKVVSFPVFYNCFLSPDVIRGHLPAYAGGEDEKEWCHEIFKRMQSINGEEFITLRVRKRDGSYGKVKVKPDFYMFVCPCNEFGFERIAGKKKTWAEADSITEHAFKRLFGEIDPNAEMTQDCYVRQFLDKHVGLDPVVRQEIEEASNLLRFLFCHKIHHDLREQPFFFPTAISELGQLMNAAIACGCKSAKDRTGNYQRFRIYMATSLHLVREDIRSKLKEKFGDKYMNLKKHDLGQVFPPVDKSATQADIYNSAAMLLCSGQMEITKSNLGKLMLKVPEFTLGPLKKLHPVIKP